MNETGKIFATIQVICMAFRYNLIKSVQLNSDKFSFISYSAMAWGLMSFLSSSKGKLLEKAFSIFLDNFIDDYY